jgi:hypothetical protein
MHELSKARNLASIDAVTIKSGNDTIQLVMTKRGGDDQGTWMHEDIAC